MDVVDELEAFARLLDRLRERLATAMDPEEARTLVMEARPPALDGVSLRLDEAWDLLETRGPLEVYQGLYEWAEAVLDRVDAEHAERLALDVQTELDEALAALSRVSPRPGSAGG